MQSNLDLNGHFLLYNSQRLYCPAVIDNIITFDSDVSIPNVYTKSEVDALIAGGGEPIDAVDALIAGGGEPIDAYTKEETNDLLALKANAADVYTKAEADERFGGGGGGGTVGDNIVCKSLTIEPLLTDSLNGVKFTSDATHALMAQMLQSGGSTAELFKFDANGKNMALLKHTQYALNDDDSTYTAHNFDFVKSADGKKSKLNITAYTKAQVDAKFRDFTTSKLKVNTIDIYPTDVTPGTGDLFANMYVRGTTATDAFLRLGFDNTFYSIYSDRIHLETQKATIGILPHVVEILYDHESDTNKLISNKSLNISTTDASNKIVIANELDIQKIYIRQEGDDIMSFRFIESGVSYPEIFKVNATDRTCTVSDFDMKCRNIYTKTECDEKFGGGGTIPDPLSVNQLIAADCTLTNHTAEMPNLNIKAENEHLYFMISNTPYASIGVNSSSFFINSGNRLEIGRPDDMQTVDLIKSYNTNLDEKLYNQAINLIVPTQKFTMKKSTNNDVLVVEISYKI